MFEYGTVMLPWRRRLHETLALPYRVAYDAHSSVGKRKHLQASHHPVNADWMIADFRGTTRVFGPNAAARATHISVGFKLQGLTPIDKL